MDFIKESDAGSVIDLGCGEGRLLQRLLLVKRLQRVVGMDVSMRSLERAEQRLKLEQKPEKIRAKLTLMQGALQYRDVRLEGFDTAVCMKVIEHMDEDRLDAFEKVLFQCASPNTVIVTTPNAEYNIKYENLPEGKLRHSDHRFEWERATFEAWAKSVTDHFGYAVEYRAVGDLDEWVGTPTQMAVFTRVG
jgi:3' terminal RNA ribose 2'-O-methyltransferase Hen1